MEQAVHHNGHTLVIRGESPAHNSCSGPGLRVFLTPSPRPVQPGSQPAGWHQRRRPGHKGLRSRSQTPGAKGHSRCSIYSATIGSRVQQGQLSFVLHRGNLVAYLLQSQGL